ncbi:MAG: hypothetical protein ACRDTU_06125 [Micromonosporaceae bacterium]
MPLLLVGTCRPVPVRAVVSQLRAMVRERDDTVIELAPLGEPDVARLASELVAGQPGPRLTEALARAGGNPLYVRELVRALLLDGRIAVAGGEAELGGDADTTPTSLSAVIAHRLQSLTGATAEVLRLAALLGNEFDVKELATVCDRTPVTLVDVMAEAVMAGVLGGSGARVSFRHDLIRRVIAEQMPEGMRIALHGGFARQLAEAGSAPRRVARHLLAVPDPLDDWVPTWLTSIPESRLSAAPQVSADLLGRAMKVTGREDPRSEELACRLAQLLYWLGRDEQLLEAAGSAPLSFTDVERAARMSLYTARAAGRTGRFEDALETLGRALGEERLPVVWRARLTAWLGMAHTYLDREKEAEVAARRALADARSCGDALAAGYALLCLWALSGASQESYLEEALDGLGDDPESIDLRMLLVEKRLLGLTAAGESEASEQAAREALVFADRIGTYRTAQLLASAAEISFVHGDWDEALVREASVAAEFLDTVSVRDGRALAATIAIHRDEPERARTHLWAAGVTLPIESLEPDIDTTYAIDAAALLAEAAGDHATATRLRALWLELPPGPIRNNLCWHLPELVRTALAAGDTATARTALQACRDAGDRTPETGRRRP